jgi:hypothetical protein
MEQEPQLVAFVALGQMSLYILGIAAIDIEKLHRALSRSLDYLRKKHLPSHPNRALTYVTLLCYAQCVSRRRAESWIESLQRWLNAAVV